MASSQKWSPGQPEDGEEFHIFVERFMQFMNLWTVYSDFLSGKYVPTVGVSKPPEEWSLTDMGPTLMFVLYGFFYSLVEDSDSALNAFRIWRQRHSGEEIAIAAVEAQVTPFIASLRVFRNRLAFHGSRSREHQSNGFGLFSKHSGTEILEAMKSFKALGASLLAMENARQGIPGCDATIARRWIDSIVEKSCRTTQTS